MSKNTDIEFKKLMVEMYDLFVVKNNHHKDKFRKRGVSGILMRIEDKIGDVESGGKENESVKECLLDIAVYALLGAICEDDNKKTIQK